MDYGDNIDRHYSHMTSSYHVICEHSDGAVYMHQGHTYICRKLDLISRVATVRPSDTKYYTKLRDYTDIYITGETVYTENGKCLLGYRPSDGQTPFILGGKVAYPVQGSQDNARSIDIASCETAMVTTRYLGFQRIWKRSGEPFDYVDLYLPDVLFETQATFMRVPQSAISECVALGLDFREGLHAAHHALLAVLPLYLLCNSKDVGADCDSPFGSRYRVERLLLYDKQHAGGVGLCAQAAPMIGLLLERALELLSVCACKGGCPSCIFHAECPSYNANLNKAAAKIVLQHVISTCN